MRSVTKRHNCDQKHIFVFPESLPKCPIAFIFKDISSLPFPQLRVHLVQSLHSLRPPSTGVGGMKGMDEWVNGWDGLEWEEWKGWMNGWVGG